MHSLNINAGHDPKIKESTPERIAHYRIVRKLGQGGMSIVYEALDEKLKRPVAIKVLHPFLAEGLEYRLRFLREALAVARLTHPNIVQIFDVANSDASEHLYIVTELLFGETLKDYVKRINLIELPELSAMIIWEIAHALSHAHQKGIIHRDIKPENIMVCKNGQLKLMDFGIASLGSEESLTQTGSLLGSLCHLSPELIKGQKATEQSDIFSLTTVFFWMLTGKLPFIGESPHALLKAIVDTPHQRTQRLSAYISDDLANIVEIGLSKDKTARFQSMVAMADAIETALKNLGLSIDTKQMQAVLREPETKVGHYKTQIFEQVKKQLLTLSSPEDVARRLLLTCRLDAAFTDNQKEKPSKKPILVKGMAVVAAAILLAVSTLFAVRFLVRNDTFETATQFAIDSKTFVETNETSDDAASSQNVSIDSEPQAPKPSDQKMEKKKAHNIWQEVTVVVWPFANIFLNGKLLGKDKKSLVVKLSPGIHTLTFTHRYAAAIEKIIKVTEDSLPLEINIQLLKSKPAFLQIKTNTDADVAVDGSYKGSTTKSTIRPIVIPIPDKRHSQIKEVFVSKEGFKPVILEVEFVAGQTKDLAIELLPTSR